MAKRVVIDCDLCKNSVDEQSEMTKISFKRAGKNTKTAFEICSYCDQKLQQQLIANHVEVLKPDWQFTVSNTIKLPIKQEEAKEEDLPDNGDFIFPEEIETESLNLPVDDKPLQQEERTRLLDTPVRNLAAEGKCYHPNKTPAKFGRFKKNGKTIDGMYRTCIDCNKSLPLMTGKEQKAFLAAKTQGLDIKVQDFDPKGR